MSVSSPGFRGRVWNLSYSDRQRIINSLSMSVYFHRLISKEQKKSLLNSSGSRTLRLRPYSNLTPGNDDGTRRQGKVDSETPMGDSPIEPGMEIYWSNHPNDDDHNTSVEDRHKVGDSGEIVDPAGERHPPPKPIFQRRPRNKSSAGYAPDNNYNGSMIKEVKHAKAEILSPNGVRDRGGGGRNGDSSQLPGETQLFSQNPGSRPSGQYQMPPGYTSMNNGANGNGNYPNGVYMPNGISSPQPHHYNTNGHPPYMYQPYPPGQPGPGYYPHYNHDQYGPNVIDTNSTSDGSLGVRGEEIGIVLVVLLLWVGAIVLFFNRWGKIRMLEPYQPKFCENHRPSCPMAEVTAINTIPVCRERAFSKFNLSTEMLNVNGSPHFVKCNYHGVPSADPAPGFSGFAANGHPGGLMIPGAGFPGGGSTGMLSSRRNSMMVMMNHNHLQHYQQHRPRQNSVFVTSPVSQVSFYGSDTTLKSSSRKTKSAVDLPTLVLSGEFDQAIRNSKTSITQL